MSQVYPLHTEDSLYVELKKAFPEIADDVVRRTLKECHNERSKCYHRLKYEMELRSQYQQGSGCGVEQGRSEGLMIPPYRQQSVSQSYQGFGSPSAYYGTGLHLHPPYQPPSDSSPNKDMKPLPPLYINTGHHEMRPHYLDTVTSYQQDPDVNQHLITSNSPDVINVKQLPIQPSPASSCSSLSSAEGPRLFQQGNGDGASNNEETAYVQALLLHQKARMDKLYKAYDLQQSQCQALLSNIAVLEKRLATKRQSRRTEFPTIDDINKLSEENKQLKLVIAQLMDKLENSYGQGITNQQSFYSNISYTGQSGPIRPSTSSSSLSHYQSPISPEENDEEENWSCTACTFLNHPALDKCECCEMPKSHIGS